MSAHQREMLRWQLEHVAFLDGRIAQLDNKVTESLHPFEREIELLDTIPGVGQRTAEVIFRGLCEDCRSPAAAARPGSA